MKKMSFEKNVLEFNLFGMKLSWEKILDQFFVWFHVAEKIAGNWENLGSAYFWCQNSAAEVGELILEKIIS